MGVDAVKSELISSSMDVRSDDHGGLLLGKENGKAHHGPILGEPIKFGSNDADEPNRKEVSNVSEVDFPKDAVDEWPAPEQIHSFFIVKYRSYEDPKLKVKLDQAEKELQRKNQARSQITEKLRAKRTERAQVIEQLKALGTKNKQFRMMMDDKRKEMEPLQQALNKLRGTNTVGKEKGVNIYSSEEELDCAIRNLQYRIQHESIPLNEEKLIVREIKQLEGTRDKVIANAAERAKIQNSMGEKEAIQDQVKLIGVNLDGVRKDQQIIRAELKQLEEEKEAIDKVINALQDELTAVTDKRSKASETLQELRNQRDEMNAVFYQYRRLATEAKQLAARKDLEALNELSNAELAKFIADYTSSEASNVDYKRRILPSLDIRQLSKDGRIRNSDEKPLVELPVSAETDVVVKSNAKQLKEESKAPQGDALPAQAESKEKSSKQKKETGSKSAEQKVEPSNLEREEEFFGLEKPPKKVSEIDDAKLKELKREEELAKAKQALERKKRLAEKAAAKAAIKAQKEAEKKIKEREKKAEKKAKKKASVTGLDSEVVEPTEAAAEVADAEKIDENVDETPFPAKGKEQSKGKERKEGTVRYRGRVRGPETLPKALLKRKKQTNYWLWAVPAAVLLLLAVLIIGFNYFQSPRAQV